MKQIIKSEEGFLLKRISDNTLHTIVMLGDWDNENNYTQVSKDYLHENEELNESEILKIILGE